ncbi:helix-turn-helix domain-containing protein [Sutterella wadsworthensis]|uniref:helix-turn-helix domain-containing protein n=1 Tax=Sutterella wadsworthensis TaxID=40545 RepID=UPI003A8EB428
MAQWIGVNATRIAWETKVETASQRLVLLAIAKYADLDGTAFPSVESLCADTCLNRKTAFKVLKELQKIGAIVVSKRQPNNGNCYSICGACPKNGSTEIGTTKNGSTEIGTGGSTKNGTPVVPKTVHEEEQEESKEENRGEVRATQIFSAEKIARPEPDLAEEINSQLRDAVDRDPDDFDPVDATPEALDIFDTEPLSVGGTKAAPCPVTEIVALYNKKLGPYLRTVRKMTPARAQAVRARWRDVAEIVESQDRATVMEGMSDYFDKIARSNFLMGRVPGKAWRADFDFIFSQRGFTRIFEDKYANG